MDAFTWRDRVLTCRTETGVVLRSDKRNETTITASGGGVSFNHGHPGLATVTSPTVTSRNILKHEFWYRRDDGAEVAVRFTGVDIPLRDGQRITLLSVGRSGQASGAYATLVNHASHQHWTITSARQLDRMTRIGRWRSARDLPDALVAAGIGLALCAVLLVLGVHGGGLPGLAACLLIGVLIVSAVRAGTRRHLIERWLEGSAQEAHRLR